MSEFKTNDYFYPWAVSADGVVKNLKTGNLYQPKVGSHGYYIVSKHLLHRMIGTLYIDNPENLPVINHKDSNKLNNSLDNLEWCTQQHNTIHARDAGRLSLNCVYGEDSNLAKFSDDVIHSVCMDIVNGHRNIDIAKKYNMVPEYVKALRAKKSRVAITSQYDMRPTNKKSVSDATVEWICRCICLGVSPKEIVEAAKNSKVTADLIKNIRRKSSYKNISDKYF